MLGQFSNERDAYQCYKRVGRFGDPAHRCGIAGRALVCPKKNGQYKAHLLKSFAALSKEQKFSGRPLIPDKKRIVGTNKK
jgi:hypothetical protein